MKIFCFILCVLMSVTLVGCVSVIESTPPISTKEIKLISEGQLTNEDGTGQIHIGITRNDFEKVLKNNGFESPRSTEDYIAVETTFYYFENGELLYLVSADPEDKKFRTAKGLELGDSIEKMKELYGTNYEYRSATGPFSEMYDYLYEDSTFSVSVAPDGKTIFEIGVYSNKYYFDD